MSLTRSSRLAVGLLALAVLVVGAFGVAAVEFDGDVPESAEVGTELHVQELSMTDPFAVGDEWTMQVSTELQDARLIVTARDGAGNPIDGKTIDEVQNDTVTMEIDDTSISRIDFEVRGDVPQIGGFGPGLYRYQDRSQENITALEIVEVLDGQTQAVENGTFEVHRFTDQSRQARQAIDEASEAAEEADSDDARDRVDEAITFYNNGEFNDAIQAAEDAQDIADSGDDSRGTLLLVGGIIAVLVAAGGIVYFWRSRQRPANKLQ